ncbi:MAG TPA: LuxR C-terminal-related transcriptional regulator [Beutenbergiaceae bacterium]|nr:LuxR C-terminal-related transcriptional regulator [Beutenbergiaceae bacterium]
MPAPLRQALEEHVTLTVLHAPRGFGKTSAVAAWVREQSQAHMRYLWVPLGLQPAGRREFWAAVHRGLTGVPPPADADPGLLVRALVEQTLQPTTLILDNFDWVADERVDDELGDLLSRFERLHAVVMVRAERPIVVIAHAHAHATVLQMPDLGLGGSEVQLMAHEAGYAMDPAQAVELSQSLAGWPAVIRAVLQDGAKDEDGGLLPDWTSVDRYCRVVLEDPDMQRFRDTLTAMSCATEFDAELGRVLIGEDAWSADFPLLHRAGILHSREQEGTTYYRLLPRIRNAIQTFLRRTSPQTYRRYHCKLAQWYDHRNKSQPALDHAVESEDWPRAAALVEEYWLEMVTGCGEEARRVLRRFPDEVVHGSARLLVMRDYILNLETPRRAQEMFRSGHMEVAFASHYENERLTLGQTLQLRATGGYEAYRQLAEEGSERSAWADPVLERMPELLLQWSITTLLTSDLASAAYAFRQAFRWARERGMVPAEREAASGLALCLAILGHLNSAEEWLALVAALPGPATSELERGATMLVRQIAAGDRFTFEDQVQPSQRTPGEAKNQIAASTATGPAAGRQDVPSGDTADRTTGRERQAPEAEGETEKTQATTVEAGSGEAAKGEAEPGREALAGLRTIGAEVAGRLRARTNPTPSIPGLSTVSQYISANYTLYQRSDADRLSALAAMERVVANLTPGRHGARMAGAIARSAIVDLCVATGEFERAYQALLDVPLDYPWARVCRCRLAFYDGQISSVLEWTEHIQELAVSDVRHGLQLHLMRACAALRRRRMDMAGNHLQEAVSLVEQSGLVRLFTLVPKEDLLRLDAEFPHVVPADVMAVVIAAPPVFPAPREPVQLSDRETEVLHEIATGSPLSRVARRLFVSENTVKSQVRNIYRKLGVHNRRDAITRAAALGILPDAGAALGSDQFDHDLTVSGLSAPSPEDGRGR